MSVHTYMNTNIYTTAAPMLYLWLMEHHMRKLAQIDGEMHSRSYRYTAEPRLDLQLAGYS